MFYKRYAVYILLCAIITYIRTSIYVSEEKEKPMWYIVGADAPLIHSYHRYRDKPLNKNTEN